MLDARARYPRHASTTPPTSLRDAHYAAREMIEQWQLPDGKPMKMPGIVPKLSDTPGGTRWLGPRLGEHTDDVLGRLGYSDAERAELQRKGVI